MPTSVGPNTKGEENLVFGYDLGDSVNSYKGEPTTNFAYLHNGRKNSSYESYMPQSATGQIAALHPGAIRVYNQNGSDISYYLNTGINISNSGVEWYNTNHAYWVYDDILKKPVVQMIDRTGVWQAKYMGLGVTWDSLGLTNGDQYTMSWLQWSSDGVKRAHAGVYWYDPALGYSGFWDGLSNTGNSTAGKWTRVSQTFTVSSGKPTDQSLTWYMYGMYYSRATLRIADVQLEKKSHATPFTFSNVRSNTQGLIDLTGNSTIDLTNVSFDSNAQMTFDGTDDKAVVANFPHIWDGSVTMEAVVAWNDDSRSIIFGNYNVGANDINFEKLTGRALRFYWNRGERDVTTASNVVTTTGNPHHVVMVRDKGVNLFKFYVDGVEIATSSNVGTDVSSTGSTFRIGGDTRDGTTIHNGDITMLKLYNRALTASEVASNYKAIKTRFNI